MIQILCFFLSPLSFSHFGHGTRIIITKKNLAASSFIYPKGFMIGPSHPEIRVPKLVTPIVNHPVQSGASYLSQGFEDNVLGSSSG